MRLRTLVPHSLFSVLQARSFGTTSAFARASTAQAVWTRKMALRERYRDWPKEALLARIAELEEQSTAQRTAHLRPSTLETAPSGSSMDADGNLEGKKGKGKKEKKPKEFDFGAAGCRKIALRFSYDGAGYSGLAAQNTSVPGSGSTLPTVEAVLWDAMCTARLVDPALGMDGAGFSRCGRTDRGVSAAGQVVALWVRSKKLNHWTARLEHQAKFSSDPVPLPEDHEALEAKRNARLEDTELPYVQILNRILPPTIRIHAWSPVRADFSSRFDCVYRHYKYFFPAGPPSLFLAQSSSSSSAIAEAASTRLDIGRMRDAAARLVGEHDFRNLCKIDASKQITNYRRRIDGVSIDRVSSHWPTQPSNINDTPEGDEEMYVLNLRGTAFLYHQVRNIMAILFLVGARLEEPSVVEELMNTHEGAIAADRVKMQLAAQAARQGDGVQWWLPVNATATTTGASPTDAPMWVDRPPTQTEDGELEIYATKPNYEMASDRPLVLWGISVAEAAEDAWAASSALLRVHKTWTQHAVSTELARHFVLASAPPHGTLPSRTRFEHAAFPYLDSPVQGGSQGAGRGAVVPLGNGTGRGAANYVAMRERPREESYELKNQRWADTTGRRRAQRRAEAQAEPAAHDD
ncbi:hypothetical protein L1887_51947 [Cichorium endivia]|nr:hypothetical protein L1887_51947 [Cichorium endivia]